MRCSTPLIILLLTLFIQADDSTLNNQSKWHWERIRVFELKYTPSLESKIDNGGSTAFSLGDAYLQIPIIRGMKNYFGAGLTYSATAPELYGAVADSLQFRTRVSQAAHILLGYNRTFSDQMNLYAEYNGGINGIWDDLGASQSHFGFFFLGYRYKRDVYFRGGAGVTYLYGQPQFFPVLGIALGLSDVFGIDILVPKHALFRFRVTPKVQVGTKIAYSLGNAGFNIVGSDRMVNYAFSQMSSSVYCDYRIVKMLTIRGEVGGYLFRNIKLIDLEDNQSYYDAAPSETPYVSISIRWQV